MKNIIEQIKWKLQRLLETFSCWINPRQKWIKDHIEYHEWCDKPELIEDFLFGCVIHFVEGEKGIEKNYWQTPEKEEVFAKLLAAYAFIKFFKPLSKIQMEREGNWPKFEKMEKDLKERTDETLKTILEIRKHLWV
jgi:hypothetical protein